MKMQMKVLAAAISAIGALGSAQASTQAQAVLQVTNVLFYDNGTNAATDAGGALLSASDFVQTGLGALNIIDSYNLNPTVNGTPNASAGFVLGGNPLPLTVQCVAAACPGMNSGAPFVPAISPPANNGAMAAAELLNNPIDGLPGNPSNGGTDASASSLAQLTGNGTANTTASLTLATVFTFTPNNDTVVKFNFDAFKYLLAYADTQVNATSNVGWNLSIQDTSTASEVFDWSPNGTGTGMEGGVILSASNCGLTDSITAFFPASRIETCTGSYSGLSPLLLAGRTYNLSIGHQTQAVVQNLNPIPEPSSLLLAGLAIAGLGVVARRKATSAR